MSVLRHSRRSAGGQRRCGNALSGRFTAGMIGIAAAVLGAAIPAHAQLLVSNFSSAPSGISTNVTQQIFEAQGFQTADTPFVLGAVRAQLLIFRNNTTLVSEIRPHDAINNRPVAGTVLASSGPITYPAAGGLPYANFAFSSALNLSANTKYWVSIRTTSVNEFDPTWRVTTNTPTETGPGDLFLQRTVTTNGGASWTQYSNPNDTQLVVEILGADVAPEPSSLALWGMGLLLGGIVRSRVRRAGQHPRVC
jgi:hypothetical protein